MKLFVSDVHCILVMLFPLVSSLDIISYVLFTTGTLQLHNKIRGWHFFIERG